MMRDDDVQRSGRQRLLQPCAVARVHRDCILRPQHFVRRDVAAEDELIVSHPRDSLSFSGGKCHCPWQQAEIGPQCAAGDHDPVDVDGVAEQQIDAKLVGELAAAVVFGLKCRPRATRPTAVIVVASDIDDALAAKPLVQPLQAPVSGALCHQRR